MTAAILTFPTLLERDEAEFKRCGTSNYLRAIEAATALWSAAAREREQLGLAGRIEAFTVQLDHLARYRPDCLGDMVSVASGCFIELRLVPHALQSILRRAAND